MQRLTYFCAGDAGEWTIEEIRPVTGLALPFAPRLTMGPELARTQGAWSLCGITSNERYLELKERDALLGVQEGLGRPQASRAALIPIRKSAAWWQLAQDERRAIFESQSHHIATGLRYLPAIARRLHHCRDLGGREPFDFLTWFEYAPQHQGAFDELLALLRATEEWSFVEREVDLRLLRC